MAKKKRSNNKAMHAAYMKRARRGLRGMILAWRDYEPLTDTEAPDSITKTEVTHRNPTQKLIAMHMWKTANKFIIETVFTWKVSVKLVYRSNRDGALKIDEGEFTLTCGIRDKSDTRLDQAIEAFITESKLANALVGEQMGKDHKSYGEYLYTDFCAEIIGV